MTAQSPAEEVLKPAAAAFYRRVLTTLEGAEVPFLVGGAYALAHYTGIVRHTKDIDIFVRPRHCEHALEVLASLGCETEISFPHWLGKAHCGEDFCDVIFSSGNGVAMVDDDWFEYAEAAEIIGHPVLLCPVEEMIWSKGYVCERERYDGADVAHLLRSRAARLDWRRLLDRFGPHWRVLFSHLVLFGFIYPGERDLIPDWVLHKLLRKMRTELRGLPEDDRVCQGPMLSRSQYRMDIEEWGYRDPRVAPEGNMTPTETRDWTEAGEGTKP